MSINEMIDRLNSLVDKKCGIGATESEVADAQRTLGVSFPASYRAFLSVFGWARIYDDVLVGLGPTVPSHYELVKTALSERTEFEPNIPHHLVPVMNDGAGNHYCLDTARFLGDECPVVFWDHEHQDGPDQSPDEVSQSFDRWLIDRIVESPYADEV